jgi:hypothetical protein
MTASDHLIPGVPGTVPEFPQESGNQGIRAQSGLERVQAAGYQPSD